ncbi:MAG: hypothetical protein E7289_00390 [Lachnospiraceae bacterium]|nr:hypothetical protein [Lachnospiraceae bacterium]
MICKCQNCSAALFYKPTSGMLECDACGAAFWPSQFEEPDAVENEMQVDYYSCTACGAQLAVNGVETSTFCSYCGQPTVVFDRVSSAKKPDYIIPFSVSKEKAVSLIRAHIEKGNFVPQEIKNFEVERVRGIYIPFWLYNVEYADTQFLSGEVGSGKNSHTEYFMRKAKVLFHDMTLDASVQLNDGVSQRLEPYDTRGLVDFHSAYLSGFYADCFDYKAEDMMGYATYRCKILFDAEVRKTIRADKIMLQSSHPYSNVVDSKYAMLPAWFMTFRYEDTPYTILVNGQTSKVVGAVPYDKNLVKTRMIVIALLIALVCLPIMYALLLSEDSDVMELIFIIMGSAFLCWRTGVKKMKDLKNSIERTKESAMHKFVKDRQEG